MRSLLRVCGVAGLVLVCAAGPAVADDGGFTIKDPRIKESSGLAASRAHPGIYSEGADSDVVRVPLKEGGAKSPSVGGSSTDSGDGVGNGNHLLGAMVLAGATVLGLGAKRVLRRRGG
ncbi:hypothetical protein [Streptomyces sp. HUAS TT7]|uniref:hypothetical protein n=1 Tax=Streptomyces sp. HUAS TT7 TaxID=3447507 RepID=UPI003F658E89